MKAEIIAVTNQKGGVGKSTTAEALAEGLHIRGYKTLLIDLDPQGSLTLSAGADITKPTSYDFLTGKTAAHEVIQKRNSQNEFKHRADIIPANGTLATLDVALAADISKHKRLKKKIAPLISEYDYIIIDTPPALGIHTLNALSAATGVLITIRADIFSLQGMEQLCGTIGAVVEDNNPSLEPTGVLLTQHNPRTVIGREMTEMAKERAAEIGTFVYDTVIRECVALVEAQSNQQSIYDYAPNSNASADYSAFVDEFLRRKGGGNG